MTAALTIGELSRQSSVKVPTIRYYEEIGLLPPPPRSEGNRRTYDISYLHRLMFIRHARELGFEIPSIRTFLTLQDEPDQSCEQADRLARLQLEQVEQRIASLKALKKELERMVTSCSHGKVADCRVINVLANHADCIARTHK